MAEVLVPAWVLPTFAAAIGLLIGSFLNVVVHRVPRGESVVRPPSACPACGHGIRAVHNVPVLGWLMLRGRCHDCSTPISLRYPLVEAGTAALFGLTALVIGPSAVLPAWLYLAAVAVALALIDIDVHRLPDAIVLPSYPVAAVLLGGAALAEHDLGLAVRAAAGLALLGGLYLVVHLVRPDGMGFGDVKLAGLLGLYLGSLGWGALAVGAFLAFLLGGLVGVVIIAAGRGGRRTRVPFGPFMLAGTFAALVVGPQIVAGYLQVAGL